MASLDIFACNTRGCLFYQVGVGSGKIWLDFCFGSLGPFKFVETLMLEVEFCGFFFLNKGILDRGGEASLNFFFCDKQIC